MEKTFFAETAGAETATLLDAAGAGEMAAPVLRHSIVTGQWQLFRTRAATAGKPRCYMATKDTQLLTHELPARLAEVSAKGRAKNPFDLIARDGTPTETLCYSVAAVEQTPVDAWCEDFIAGDDSLAAADGNFADEAGVAVGPTAPLIRAFDNKFPMMAHADSPDTPIEAGFVRGLHPQVSAIGRCEVVVMHWRFNWCAALGTPAEGHAAWKAFARRFCALASDPRNAFIRLFENHGDKSGGSVPHSHAQLWGLPIIPREQRVLYDIALAYAAAHGGKSVFDACVEDVVAGDGDGGSRILCSSDACVAFVPFVSERYNEMWVVPRGDAASSYFGDATPATLAAVADAVRICLRMIYVMYGDPTYNVIVRTAPPPPLDAAHAAAAPERAALSAALATTYRWHIQIVPSVSIWSGVKTLGFIVGGREGLPEEQAENLRSLESAPLPSSSLPALAAVAQEDALRASTM